MSGDSGEEGERCQGRAELVWEGLGGRFFGARAPWLVHRGRIVRFSVQPPRLSTLCIQALQKKLSLNSAKLSGRLGTSPALLATGDLTRERLTDRKHGLENIPATLGGEVFAMGADDDED
ncbi:unnamed protein product, partial [Prorocentrum cordatum]